jgi:cytochrome P450
MGRSTRNSTDLASGSMVDSSSPRTEYAAQFAHHSHAHAADAPNIFRNIRKSGGVAHSDLYGGYYILTKYADIAAAARDHQTFSSKRDFNGPGMGGGGLVIPPDPATYLSLDELDPPEWKRIRGALNPKLAPGSVTRMMPSLHEITTFFIDRFIEAGHGDLVLDVANPVPAIMTLDFLGLPRNEWERYADPIHRMNYVHRERPEYAEVLKGVVWVLDELRAHIEDRRRIPQDDLISYLIQHDAGGTPFTDKEIEEMLFLALAGGLDTTTALMSNAFYYFSEHPDERRRLQEDPSLIDFACEEFLRFFTPVQALARTVAEPVTVGGVQMQRGDHVLLTWASANRDDDQFDNPDEIVLNRFPNRHCSFGIGIHRCTGSNLARSTFKFVVPEVLRRVPDYRVVESEARRYDRIGAVNGWEQMPVTFHPGHLEGTLTALF